MHVLLSHMLLHAQENKYAVGAFNVNNFEYADAFIKAAEETNSPLILQFSPGVLRTYQNSSLISACAAIANESSAPICLHVDHAKNIADIHLALSTGVFHSFMIDGSALPLEENIQLTNETSDLLHSSFQSKEENIFSIEAEIGHVGTSQKEPSHSTTLEEVNQFINATHVDALAISIGNIHGENDRNTELDIPLLARIRNHCSIPLVLHGSSGIRPNQVQLAISNGITKVNVNTYFKNAFTDTMCKNYEEKGNRFFKEYKLYHPPIHDTLKAKAIEMVQLLGSNNQSTSVFSSL
ncbi:MAG TPA: class II fructose-bisphosphate aldolase [Caldisericia bacterium]|nr:class II fructose-bisphosphate aldolase [Caldisericia bacterium]